MVRARPLELTDGGRARLHPELLEDPRYVPFDGAHAEKELAGDLAVALAGGDELHDLELAAAEPGDAPIAFLSGVANGAAELSELPARAGAA